MFSTPQSLYQPNSINRGCVINDTPSHPAEILGRFFGVFSRKLRWSKIHRTQIFATSTVGVHHGFFKPSLPPWPTIRRNLFKNRPKFGFSGRLRFRHEICKFHKVPKRNSQFESKILSSICRILHPCKSG